MLATSIGPSDDAEVHIRPTRRFSEGMERVPLSPSVRRVGRFSDGTAPSVTLSPDQIGSFADGLVNRPDASAVLRVGSFADGYRRLEDRALHVRRPRRPAPAPA